MLYSFIIKVKSSKVKYTISKNLLVRDKTYEQIFPVGEVWVDVTLKSQDQKYPSENSVKEK